MLLKDRIRAFVKLGDFLCQFTPGNIVKKDTVLHNDLFFDAFKTQIKRAQEFNGWFTEDNILYAFNNWSKLLNYNDLKEIRGLFYLMVTGVYRTVENEGRKADFLEIKH